jgi:hypothetical protein
VSVSLPRPLLSNRLDIHDRKQFELKLEYQPNPGTDASYLVEAFLFLPASLNITSDTYPRGEFYGDIRNYLRLKTPVMELNELLQSGQSPLDRLERWAPSSLLQSQPELIYEAKMLACVFRGALRRFTRAVLEGCELESQAPVKDLVEAAKTTVAGTAEVLRRFRAFAEKLSLEAGLTERTRASLRLIDEYMSLTVEQFLRRCAADTSHLSQGPEVAEMRRRLLAAVLAEETYRKGRKLPSVLNATGENEEYLHRMGVLKKFCMNILFLEARRDLGRQTWEEVALAMAAGLSMTFAAAVAFLGQRHFSQASLNFTFIVVVGYMFKDRIKESLRALFSRFARRHLFDRGTEIHEPVTRAEIGHCEEKVDYTGGFLVPPEVEAVRSEDDLVTVAQDEMGESVLRYQKRVVVHADRLAKMPNGCTGVTDIMRINVERFLRDMDDPELALDYVEEDLSVGRVRAAKSYAVDLVFRFQIHEDKLKETQVEYVRLVLDRNGIKRMQRKGGKGSVRASNPSIVSNVYENLPAPS